MKLLFKLCAFVVALAFSQNAFAAEGDLPSVRIQSLGIIATATGGHMAGNMEIKIFGGFTLPAGVNCDKNYITTRKTADPDGRMFSLLQQVVGTPRSVQLRITDNPAATAWPGRCSLLIVVIS